LFKNLSAITGERLADQVVLPAQQPSENILVEPVADERAC
jgi:hypothetical protein